MKYITLIVFIVLFSGCTKEYMAERSKCNDLAYSEYPQKMEQRIEQRYKSIQVPSGTNCSTYNGYTTCNNTYRTETIPYTEVVNVDLNKGARQAWARECARNSCYDLYGNADCKTN